MLFPEFDTVQAGIEAREDGMRRAEQHASTTWLEAAKKAARAVARNRSEFTTDPVWKVLQLRGVPEPHEPRAMGPVMDAMVKAGVCARTERMSRSVRPECHRRPLTVYQSLIFGKGVQS
jgi:hypothetical protein